LYFDYKIKCTLIKNVKNLVFSFPIYLIQCVVQISHIADFHLNTDIGILHKCISILSLQFIF